MVFNSKQLEELESIHDSTGAFEEEGDDESGFDEVGEAAMDWRRGIIEEAAESIKRAKTRPVDAHIQYPIGAMLYDRDVRRFARVQRSVPGYLKIVYLSGEDRELGFLDVVAYLKDSGAEKRLSELAEQLGMAMDDVGLELDRLGITPQPEAEEGESTDPPPVDAVPPPVFAKSAKRALVADDAAEDEEDSDDLDEEESEDDVDEADDAEVGDDVDDEIDVSDDDEQDLVAPAKGAKNKVAAAPAKASQKAIAAKAPTKPAAPPAKPLSKDLKSKVLPKPVEAKPAPKVAAKPAAKAAAKPAEKAPPRTKASASPANKNANPIDDPNGYIKANFQEMSNRELARVTGLSEHTIRRKLGEWGLKRKKEV